MLPGLLVGWDTGTISSETSSMMIAHYDISVALVVSALEIVTGFSSFFSLLVGSDVLRRSVFMTPLPIRTGAELEGTQVLALPFNVLALEYTLIRTEVLAREHEPGQSSWPLYANIADLFALRSHGRHGGFGMWGYRQCPKYAKLRWRLS